MSIYATLWKLKFPSEGDAHSECEWIFRPDGTKLLIRDRGGNDETGRF